MSQTALLTQTNIKPHLEPSSNTFHQIRIKLSKIHRSEEVMCICQDQKSYFPCQSPNSHCLVSSRPDGVYIVQHCGILWNSSDPPSPNGEYCPPWVMSRTCFFRDSLACYLLFTTLSFQPFHLLELGYIPWISGLMTPILQCWSDGSSAVTLRQERPSALGKLQPDQELTHSFSSWLWLVNGVVVECVGGKYE